MMLQLLLLTVSLVLLYVGAEALVRGGASLALRLRVSALTVGLTVVAYGTSFPELLVSVKAALAEQGDIAVGNVVGSNIFNVAFILGLAATIYPLRVQFQLIKWDIPILLLVTAVFGWFFRDAVISRGEAVGLCVGLLVYTIANLYLARRAATAPVVEEFNEALPPLSRHWGLDIGLIGGGLLVLALGARWLVESAVALARGWSVSEAVIGLTIVAAGTSIPELATTTVAALKKQPDIAVGNVVGSNIYNLLGIVGISGVLTPLVAPEIRTLDLATLTVLTVVLLPILRTGMVVKRWEGMALLGSYGVYLALHWPR